jgi:PAS domain S-box-containing protein
MSPKHSDPITQETRMPPRLIVQQSAAGFSAGTPLVLQGESVTLGRDANCGLRFDESGVSRRHATITRQSDGTWTLNDLSSTNGTWVNGRSVNTCRLRDGDELRLGATVVLRFAWAGQQEGLSHAVAGAQVTLFSCELKTFEFTWSEAFDRMLDVPAGMLSGAPLKLETVVAQEDCARLRAALLLADRGTPMDIEIRTNVGHRILELRGERVPGAKGRISGSAWDVTARHRQTQGLRRHAALFESFTDAVALLDLEGRVLDCNSATVRLLGTPKEALVGRTLDTGSRPNWTADALDKVRRLGRFEDEWRQQKEGAAECCCEVVVTPLRDEQGQPQGFVVAYRDVTETRALQARLVAADRLTAMGTLAAGVAHEINNPLAYLRANLAHILTACETQLAADAEMEETIQDCVEGVERIARIVRDLKFFSHQGSSEVAPTDVTAAIRIASKMAEPVLRHRVALSLDVGELPLARAEEARLSQVLLNLLINAAQAMPEDRAEGNRIVVCARAEAGGVLIEVTDNAAGMTPDVLKRVFDPFFTTKPTGVGTGLGLSICHGIIESFGGTITARSTVGTGTTFRVWLNTAAEATEPAAAQKKVAKTVAPALRVLVIDDEGRVLKALARMLGSTHQVTCVHDAQEALARSRGGNNFDVVLCDVMLPSMTGLELYEKLTLERPDLAERFIFMTGGGFSPRIQQQLDGTGRPMIEKPLDQARLFELIHSHRPMPVKDDTLRFALVS